MTRRLLYDTEAAAEQLSLCADVVREEAREGRLHGIKRGRKWLFTHEALEDYVDALLQEAEECQEEKESDEKRAQARSLRFQMAGTRGKSRKASEASRRPRASRDEILMSFGGR